MPRQITVEELAALCGGALPPAPPPFLLDVRQPWENETCALAGSVLIPLPELEERWAEVQAAAPAGALIVAYCHHGVRSLSAAALLEDRGVGPVASLAGGIDAWSRRIDPTLPRY
jgi:rhodanese-related sulfurtransferase